MQRAITNNINFIHAGQAVFTFNTFINKSWYKKYDNIEVYDQKVKVVTHAILAGISEDSGLESYIIHPRPIKQEQYIEFLHKLRGKYYDQEIILFVDDISVHKTGESKKAYEELNITPHSLMESNSYGVKSRLTTRNCCCLTLCKTCLQIQQT